MAEENEDLQTLPELSDDTILLKPVSRDLGPSLFHIMKDEELMRYVLPPSENVEAASNTLANISSFGPQWAGWWGIMRRDTSEYIGLMMYYGVNPFNRYCSIAYVVSKNYQKTGVAFRSAAIAIDYLLKKQGLNRIEAEVELENKPSISLLHRLGFKLDASCLRQRLYLAGSFHDVGMYSMLANEWKDKDY